MEVKVIGIMVVSKVRVIGIREIKVGRAAKVIKDGKRPAGDYLGMLL